MATVNITQNIIGENKFKLGTQPTYGHMITDFVNQFQQEISDANIKFIRLMVWTTNNHNPVTRWNGNDWEWNQSYLNELYQILEAVENINAEPLICILNNPTHTNRWPQNMPIDGNGLPLVGPYAELCRQWAQKCVDGGFRPVYWEVMNEIFQWVGWGTSMTQKHHDFLDLFIEARNAIKDIIPEAKVSFDFSAYKFYLQGIINSRPDVTLDFLDFHRYDHDQAPENLSDVNLINKADEHMFITGGYMNWTVAEMKTAFESAYGITPEVLITECNANAWQSGIRVDPRNANIIGSIRSALTFRQCVLNDVVTHIHFTMSSNRNFHQESRPPNDPTYGVGYGLLDTTGTQWPTYKVHKLFGSNIALGDSVYEAQSNDADVRVLAWKNNNRMKLLLINKSTSNKTIDVTGLQSPLEYQYIDGDMPIEATNIVMSDIGNQVTLGNYGIMILSEKEGG